MKGLIFAILKGIKLTLQAVFHNILNGMKQLRSLIRMMFQNVLTFLERFRLYIIDMYHAIADMLVNFFKELLELGKALGLLLAFYVPGILGLSLSPFLGWSRFWYWGSWGYMLLITLVGIFYRPEGASILSQAEASLSKLISPKLLSDDHYFKYAKELIQQWKDLQQSIETEEKAIVVDHLKGIAKQYEDVLVSCNEYCQQGIKIRKYLSRKNPERISEEIRQRQLEATSSKDEHTRKNYLSAVSKLEDEFQQINFYKQKLEHLDSFLIKTVATIRNVHSKVLQVGVSGELDSLGDNIFQELEMESEAISEVLSNASDIMLRDQKGGEQAQSIPEKMQS